MRKTIISEKKTYYRTGTYSKKIVKTEAEQINHLLTHILTNNITKLNELIYAEAKLVCDKIGITLKSQTETQNFDRKSTKTNNNEKREEKRWNMLGRKGKSNTTI